MTNISIKFSGLMTSDLSLSEIDIKRIKWLRDEYVKINGKAPKRLFLPFPDIDIYGMRVVFKDIEEPEVG